MASFDRPLQEQRDQDGQKGLGRDFYWLRSCGKSRGLGAQVSSLEGEGVPKSSPSIEFGKVVAIAFLAPGIDV